MSDYGDVIRQLEDYAVLSTRNLDDVPRLCAEASETLKTLLGAVDSLASALNSVREKLEVTHAQRAHAGVVTKFVHIAVFDQIATAIAEIDAVLPRVAPADGGASP